MGEVQGWAFGGLVVPPGFLLARDPLTPNIQGLAFYLGYFLNPQDIVCQCSIYPWGAFFPTALAPADDAHLVPPTARMCVADKRSPAVPLWTENTILSPRGQLNIKSILNCP